MKSKETKMDERNDIVLAKAGDRDAMYRLIKANEGLITNICRKFPGDLDELRQIAVIGFMEGVREYDLDYDVKIITFAYFRIRKHLLWAYHKHRVIAQPKKIQYYCHQLHDNFDKEKVKKDYSNLYDAIGTLLVRHQHVLRLRYLKKFTLREISDKIGKTHEHVRQVQERALKILHRDHKDLKGLLS